MSGIIACCCINLVGCQRKVWCHIGNEIETDDEGYQADDKRLHHITSCKRQNHWEEVEHTCQRCQRQELVAWQEDCDSQDNRNQNHRCYQGSRMTDNQGRTHTDMNLLAVKLGLHQLLCLLRDRLQTVDKQGCNTRNQLHHSTHRYTQEENLLDIELGCPTYQGTYDNTEYQWLTEHTKLLLQSLCIDIELREARNHIEEFIENDSEWHETLAEWLRNRDTIQIVIFLESVGCQVCTNQRVDVADDSCEIAPKQTLAHHEVSHCTDKGEVPVVPEVDIYGTCCLGNQHQEVDTQTYWDNQCAHCCIVSYSCSCRPSHVKNI